MPLDRDTDIEQVPGDGGDGAVSKDQLQGLKDAALEWDKRAQSFWEDRALAEETRFCRWDGQSSDGRLHSAAFNNREVVPFEGASDQRVRWADALCIEKCQMLLVALMRAQPRCEGRGKGDQPKAQMWTTLARWAIDILAVKWLREHAVMLNYALQDTPAVAGMHVTWRREIGLDLEELTVEQLRDRYMELAQQTLGQMAGQVGPEAAQEMLATAADAFMAALTDKDRGQDELAGMLQEFFDGLKPARARKIIRQIRDTGRAEFPVKRVVYEGPDIHAMRFGDDFIVPDNTTDFQRASPWFRLEWLTEAELRGRSESDGWDADFIEDVLGQEGVTVFTQYESTERGSTAILALNKLGPEKFRGKYQVAHAYFWGINEDDIPARYECVFHPNSERTAFGRRMLRDRHGKWPAVIYQRETLTSFMLDSRGIPELIGPAQGIVKGLHDSGTDAGTVWALPPILAFGLQNHGNTYLEPMRLIQGKRDARFEPVQAPAYPVHVKEHLARIESERDWYFGRPVANDPDPQRAATARELEIVAFLGMVRETVKILVALVQQHASDELLARITDRAGDAVSRSREEIQGEFDVRLVFDPRDLDFESVVSRATAVRDVVLAIDKAGTVDTTPLAQGIFRSIFPYMADDVLRPVDQAESDELLDEARNLTLIRAGVMPQLNTEGTWNYQLRFDWYTNQMTENPAIFDDMGPDKRQLLMKWLGGMQQQATQFGKNVEIGRTGIAEETEE
jgi:hypothetical protein